MEGTPERRSQRLPSALRPFMLSIVVKEMNANPSMMSTCGRSPSPKARHDRRREDPRCHRLLALVAQEQGIWHLVSSSTATAVSLHALHCGQGDECKPAHNVHLWEVPLPRARHVRHWEDPRCHRLPVLAPVAVESLPAISFRAGEAARAEDGGGTTAH